MLAAAKDVTNPDLQPFMQQIAFAKVGSDIEEQKRRAEFANQQIAAGRQPITDPQGNVTGFKAVPGYGQAAGQNQAEQIAARTPAEVAAAQAMIPVEVQRAGGVARATGDQSVTTAEKMAPVAARTAGLTTTATEEAALPFVGPKAAAQAEGALPSKLAIDAAAADAKARADAPGKAFERADKLRDEYNTLTKDFRTVQDAYSKIRSTSDTGAGDMSLLYSYVKLLDPGSVVRESEFATAAASGSYGERVQGAVQRILTGQRLPATLRDAFKSEADSIYLAQKSGADRMKENYTDLAGRYGIDPKDVIQDYSTDAKKRRKSDTVPKPPPGFEVTR